MVSLDQIRLLQEKVEGAVKKIAQLQAENDALRTKCAELSNSLSVKSEQIAAFEKDQNKIENGILKALDRLNAIENTILNAAESVSTVTTTKTTVPAESSPAKETTETVTTTTVETTTTTVTPVESDAAQTEESANGEFDIF